MSRERDTQDWNCKRSLQEKPMLIWVRIAIYSSFHYILHQLCIVFFNLLHHGHAFQFHPSQSYLPQHPPPCHDPPRSLPPESCHRHSSPPKLNPPTHPRPRSRRWLPFLLLIALSHNWVFVLLVCEKMDRKGEEIERDVFGEADELEFRLLCIAVVCINIKIIYIIIRSYIFIWPTI